MADREPLVAELRRLFDRDEWENEEHYSWWPKQDQGLHLCSFRLKEPERYYSHTSFHFVLDKSHWLTIRYPHRSLAQVSHLDEVASFIQECKRRLERRNALKKRRHKVRGFRQSAMVAQLKQLGRQERFDFVTEFNKARVKLWIRLPGDNNALHLHFSPKRFQEVIPRLPEIVRTLRETYDAGVSFKVVTEQSLPWRTDWIRYQDDDTEE